MPLTNGQILQGRYRIVGLLGQGGMGAVYLAEDMRLTGRRCAIKENIPDPNASPQALAQIRRQFHREASTLATLDHPNLPKVSDYFSHAGNEYIVMDYVEGEDLESALQRHGGPLPEKPVLIWADQVLDALEYLHNHRPNPIIHRDIKPANVVLTPQGKVKLVDFGLVKLLDPNDPRTATVMQGLGTPEYAPLEQYAGSAGHTDARSDIYSLGATLYHLLTGVAPPDVHQRLLDPTRLAPPRRHNPGLSAGTETAILRAMEIYPNQRYQTVREMRQALARQRQPTVQPPTPQPTPPAPPRPAASGSGSGTRAGILAIVGPVLIGLAVLIWYLYPQFNGTRQPTISQKGTTVIAELITLTPIPVTATSATIGTVSGRRTPTPASPSPTPISPTPTLPTNVKAGIYAKVTGTGGFGLRFKSGPGGDYVTWRILPEGEILKITGGPEEVGGVIWWRAVDKTGLVGWAAERFLVPVPPPAWTPEPERTPDLAELTPMDTPVSQASTQPGMVFVPAGPFIMGSETGESDERPVHTILLDAFWIDRYEVTNENFKQFVDTTGYRTEAEKEGWGQVWISGGWVRIDGANWRTPQGPGSSVEKIMDHPVVQVSWNDAIAYCNWVNKRLPTEAEWEKAARGDDGRVYPWGNDFDATRLNSVKTGAGGTKPVGSFETGRSPYGAYDMAGNVWEWVADWYQSDYYRQSPDINPAGPSHGTLRVLRGGAWDFSGGDSRSADRGALPPSARGNTVGFRCAHNP